MLVFFTTAILAADDEYIAQLKVELDSSFGCNKAHILNELSAEHWYKDPKLSMEYAEEALEISRTLNCKLQLAVSYRFIGINYKNKSNYAKAKQNYEMALQISRELKNEDLTSDILNSFALLYWQIGELDQSLKTHFENLKLREALGDSSKIAITNNNIGLVYFDLDDFNNALRFFKVAERFEQIKGAADNANNIGMVYTQLDQFDSAAHYYAKSLELHKAQGNRFGEAQVCNNMGIMLIEQGQYEEAVIHEKKALEIAKNLNFATLVAENCNNLGRAYLKLKKYNQSRAYLHKGLAIADSLQLYQMKKTMLVNLIDLATTQNQTSEIVRLQNQLLIVNDAIHQEVRNQQVEVLKENFEAERKEKEIIMLKNENNRKALIIERQLLHIVITTALLIISSIVFFVVYHTKKIKRKSQLIRDSLEQQELMLQASIESQETERRRIAKDLHDGLGQILIALKLAWEGFFNDKSLSPELQKKANQSAVWLKQASEEVRNISHQMMPRSISEAGLRSAIQDLLDQSFMNSTTQYDFEAFNLDDRYGDDFEINIYRIVQEIIANTLKHAKASKFDLQILRNNDAIVINVEDNGIGFELGPDKRTGNGISNIRSRVQLLNGHMNIISGKGKGTNYTIRIPL